MPTSLRRLRPVTVQVGQAILTVTANNQQRQYGQPNPPLTFTITGFVNGDTSAVISGTPIVTTTATTSSTVGSYPITPTQGSLTAANYSFAFVQGTLVIVKAQGSVVASYTPNPPVAGVPGSLTATVPAGETGTITFYSGGNPLGTVPIIGTTATFTGINPAAGVYVVTAVYNGDQNYLPATSAPINVQVLPDYSLQNLTPPQTAPPGAAVTYQIELNPLVSPLSGPVVLSASNLPPGATYTFNPPSVTLGTTPANSTFTVQLPQQSAAARSRSTPLFFAAILLLPLTLWRNPRRKSYRLLVWLPTIALGLGATSGCGVGGYFSQSSQTYTITVTGTSGSLVRTTTVTLTVE